MTRWQTKVAQWKHRILFRFSQTYRLHDSIVQERSNLRRVAAELRIRVDGQERQIAESSGQVAIARDEAKQLEESAERAHRELFGERALRESAERRAEQYHADCMAAMKSHADWLALAVSRRPVFSERKEAGAEREATPIKGKPFARSVARQFQDATLEKLWRDIRADAKEQEATVDEMHEAAPI